MSQFLIPTRRFGRCVNQLLKTPVRNVMCWEFRHGGPSEYRSFRGQSLQSVPSVIPQSTLYLDLSENCIENVTNIPKGIRWLDLSYNPISTLSSLNQCLHMETLEMDHCLIKEIKKGSFSSSLQVLSLYGNNELTCMGNFPPRLISLFLGSKKISKLASLPPTLQFFRYESLGGEKIKKLENLPASLSDLSICHQDITGIDNIPPNLKRLSLFSNQIRVLENVPDSVEFLELTNNRLELIRHIPRHCKRLLFTGRWDLNHEQVSKLRNHPEKWDLLLNLIRSHDLHFKKDILDDFFAPLQAEEIQI
jgi:hypothetical protein